MVEHIVRLLMYLPLATEGFARTTALISIEAFSASLSAAKLDLPTGQWMQLVLSRRNSTLPALTSLIAVATSVVTVPVLGFGMRPRGPRILPRRPTERI